MEIFQILANQGHVWIKARLGELDYFLMELETQGNRLGWLGQEEFARRQGDRLFCVYVCVLWRLGKAKEVGSGVKGTCQALPRELDTWTCIQLRVRQLANVQRKTAACCRRSGSPDLLWTGCCQGKGMRSVSQASRASKPQREREAVQRTTVIGCGLRRYLPRVHAHTQ